MTTEPSPIRILLADDQPDVLKALRLLLKAEGFEIRSVDSPEAVLSSVRKEAFDLLLMDLNYTRDTTSGEEGLDLLSKIQQLDLAPVVIVMTAWGSVELVVEAMRRGARDFVMKPWENDRLVASLRKHVQEPPPNGGLAGPPARHELGIARRVQQRLLPHHLPEMETLEYAGHCLQAGAVGGDYYDFLDLGEGQTLFVLADVSGKGIAAALLMANLQATLRSHCTESLEHELPFLMRTVNHHFFDSTEPEHFATAFVGIYDDRTRGLRYVNCGHNPPLLLRAGGRVDRLDATATVLGAFTTFRCHAAETSIAPGEVLAVFSDGVTEARREDDEQFGESRLANVLRKHAAIPVSEIPAKLTQAVADFSGFGQEDDLTLIVARGV